MCIYIYAYVCVCAYVSLFVLFIYLFIIYVLWIFRECLGDSRHILLGFHDKRGWLA